MGTERGFPETSPTGLNNGPSKRKRPATDVQVDLLPSKEFSW